MLIQENLWKVFKELPNSGDERKEAHDEGPEEQRTGFRPFVCVVIHEVIPRTLWGRSAPSQRPSHPTAGQYSGSGVEARPTPSEHRPGHPDTPRRLLDKSKYRREGHVRLAVL